MSCASCKLARLGVNAYALADLDEQRHLNLQSRFERGRLRHAAACSVPPDPLFGVAHLHLDVRRKLHTDGIAVELLNLHDEVVDEQQAIVAEQLGPQGERLE